MLEPLPHLASLIRIRNQVEEAITAITQRPAAIGHLGEFIAAQIFQIELVTSASHKSLDGHFTTGSLTGASVNIKWYAKREGLLDITPLALPDYYLVLAGPKSTAMSSRGLSRPWLIDSVYLFRADSLVGTLQEGGVKIGIATSVRSSLWADVELFPTQANTEYILSEQQRQFLTLFGRNS